MTVVVVIAVLATVGTGVGTSVTAVGAGTVSDSATQPAATNPVAAQQGATACSFPTTVIDATGTEVTVREEPQRIVVLAPSDAQTLWAIGAREKVVGMPVDQYTSYLDGTQGKADVTNADGSVNTERVVGLQPDVVFAANVTPPETVRQLRGAGLTVYTTRLATSIEDVYGVTERYGQLSGECAGANETVSEMRTRVSEIEAAVNGTEEPPVLYYFYNYTAGTGTHIQDVVQTAGARNIAAQAGISGYQPVNAEIVASRNPEWIVHPSGAPIPGSQPYSTTTALQENQTVTLDANLLQQPGPRIVLPLTRLARALHPEAMNETTLTPVDFSAASAPGSGTANASGTNASANATATEAPMAADGGNGTVTTVDATDTTATAGDAETTAGGTGGTDAGTGTTAEGTETTGTSGPGFGLVGAVVAVLAAALLARYRG